MRRNGGGRGRRPGERREEKRRTDSQGRPVVQGRPRKTQEELDQEMDDYWGNNANAGEAATTSIEKPTSMPTAAAAALPAVADDDVDMIEWKPYDEEKQVVLIYSNSNIKCRDLCKRVPIAS